jgi:hypothetical protein
MFSLQPPRHIPTLPIAKRAISARRLLLLRLLTVRSAFSNEAMGTFAELARFAASASGAAQPPMDQGTRVRSIRNLRKLPSQ